MLGCVKCLSNKDREWFPTFVTIFVLYGGLNHILFPFHFLVAVWFDLMWYFFLKSVFTYLHIYILKSSELVSHKNCSTHQNRQMKLQRAYIKLRSDYRKLTPQSTNLSTQFFTNKKLSGYKKFLESFKQKKPHVLSISLTIY